MNQATATATSNTEASAREALEGMTAEDWAWISQASACLCAGDTLSPEELVSETLARYLVGQRAWNTEVPLRTQVWNAMRSILHSWRKARTRHPECSLDELMEKVELGVAPELPAVLSPEREARFEELNRLIEDAFQDDQLARDLLAGMAEGMSPRDIQNILDITPTTYESTQRRIRRRLAKLRTSGELS